MNKRAKKILKFTLRWGIAVVGIWWVVSNISLRDRVLALDANNIPQSAVLHQPSGEDAANYEIIDPITGMVRTIPASAVVSAPDRKQVSVQLEGKTRSVKLLGLRLLGDVNHNPKVALLLVEDPKTHHGVWVTPADAPSYELHVPHPRVQTGLLAMTRQADHGLLWCALLIFPVTYLITAYRWRLLMRGLDIFLPMSRTFILNMVGAFYNTFMPGSTGGDVLKAYYVSKQTPHRVHAVMSVVVDRVIGLIALIILGGAMAGVMALYIRYVRHIEGDPVARMCARVAALSGAMMAAMAVGLIIFYTPKLRRLFLVDFLLARLPMQQHVRHVMDVMDRYRRRPMLVCWATIVSFPVHITTVTAAMLAGWAFALPISPGYYFVAVPVIVLVGAIPISPQGAGVMEYFAIKLTERQGATLSQAFALTMSIRVVQILWNLFGGVFVFRGGYHAPTEREQSEMEGNDRGDDDPPAGEGKPATDESLGTGARASMVPRTTSA